MTIDASSNATIHVRGGGVEKYLYSGNPSNPYPADVLSQAVVTTPGAGVYHRNLPDGSIEVFNLADGTGRYFMTALINPRGVTTTTMQYDANFRLTAVLNANNDVCTISYVSNTLGNSGFYKITSIADGFGRSCSFSFDGTNTFLLSITDSVGIVSSFTYNTSTSFILTMTNPYGTTSFNTYSITAGYTYPARGLAFTFPDGTTSVIENTLDLEMETHLWDREAMARYPNDPTNRIFSHCQTTKWFAAGVSEKLAPIVSYSKMPLESQVTSTYPSSNWPNFFAPSNRPSTMLQRNDTSIRTRFSISGPITPGDIMYVKVSSNVLPGGEEIVPYTVQSGDTASSILNSFVSLLNNNTQLNKRGYYAEMDGAYLVTVPQDIFYTYSQSYTSVGATETFAFELEGDWSRSPPIFTIGGTMNAGDTVTLYSPFAPSYPQYTYTVQTGDTAETVVKNLAYILTSDSTFRSKNAGASPLGNKLYIRYGWGGGNFWGSSTGGITISGTGVTDQSKSEYEWNALGYPTKVVDPVGREMTYQYAANNIDLLEIHETRDSNDFVLAKWTYNSQHLPLTYKDGSGQQAQYTYNVFGQLTSVTDALANLTTYEYTSTATATIGGTISAGNQASITVNDPALPGGTETVSHTATAGQTPANVASALTSAINSNTDLQTLGVTAAVNGAVITLKSISVNATTYSKSVTGGVTVTLTAVKYGFLTKVTGPLQQNDKTTLVWNPNGTLASSTDAEGYTLAFEYDAMDRLVKTTFPDGTTERTVFQDLDAIFSIDRLGRTTQRSFDNMDQLSLEIDPLGRKTKYTWCSCGSISTLEDAAGHTTTWNHDLQGRVIEKVLEDGTTTKYIWEPNRSVVQVKRDALGQNSQYYRNWDGTLSSVGYPNAVNATSSVLNVYDMHYNRLTQARNAWGSYNYAYTNYITNPSDPPITGGGRLSAITNSVIPNSNITFQYDQLGRTTNRSINGAANSITWAYDAMSRVTSEANALGTFNFTYVDNVSPNSKGLSRLASIAYPNGQTTKFTWFDNARDKRLRTIQNLSPTSQALSQFDYSHDASGQITRWLQQQKSNHVNLSLDYDAAGQLTGAVGGRGTPAPTFANQHFYAYDAAANRTAVQQSQVQNIVIGGTKTTGNVVTVNVFDSALPGGTQAVNYTVVAADTLTTISTKLAATITANANLQAAGIDAVSSSTTITLRSKSPNITTYTTGLSGGATVTATAGINHAIHNASIGGTVTTGDIVSLTVRDAALAGGQTTVNYTVAAGNTLTTIAAGLTTAINGNSSLSGAKITATSSNTVITIQSLSPNVTSYSASVSGAATETVTLGPSMNSTLTAQIGGTKTTGDVLTITVFDAGLPGGSKAKSYTVLAADTLTTITTGLRNAINNDADMRLIGVTATSSTTTLTVKSVSRNATSYLPYKSTGATETILWDLPVNGTVTAAVGGTKTTGDVLTITVFDSGLAGGSKVINHTVAAGDTLNTIASGIATKINADTSLQAIGVTAVASIPTASVSVVNITSLSKRATTYTKSLSGGATETIALSKNVGVSQATFNNVNELTGISAGGTTRFQGNTDRPVLPVTINSNPAEMLTSQSFLGNATLTSGSNSVSVSATAGGGSGTTTNNVKLDAVGAASQSLTYDANGNMTSDGTNTYAWDAENRLIQITYPSSGNNSQFTFDPFGRTVKIVETVSSSITSTKQHIWCGNDRCEERDAGGAVTKQFLSQGQRNSSSNYFYGRDHLGSIRGLTDGSGVVQASYSFDPFGRPTKLQETVASDFGFAGYYLHARSGLNLTVARAYSPVLGRFISRDPIAEMGGINLYGYVSNNPLRFVDPGGLQQRYPPCKGRTTPGGFGVSNYSWENQGSPPQNPPLHDPFATGTQTETAPPETESTEDTSWEGEEYFGPKEGPYPDLKPTPEYEGIDNFLDYMQDYHPDPPNWLVEVTLES